MTTQPAITPEEWAKLLEPKALRYDSSPNDLEYGVKYALIEQGPGLLNERHALAAACLHGQEFGFTWEMVDRLRSAASGISSDSYNFEPEDRPALVDIADRIAALLPPRTP